jgi:hypothetical protein
VKHRLAICALTLAALGCGDSSQAPATTLLVVVRAGTGSGAVSSSVAGIDCGSDCSEAFPEGTVVVLTGTPAPGSAFSGWSGGSCSGTGACMVTLTATTSVTATFTLNRYPLTVSRSGNGAGRVVSIPTGIDCGSDCGESYDHGTSVTLTAGPSTGSTFVGWSGAGCSGSEACAVNVTGATAVTATFELTRHTLTVNVVGGGGGTVTSTPAGLSCGSDCSEEFNYGARVTLTATSSVGSTFAGWSGGGCSGTGACLVTVTAATGVTATFNRSQHALTIIKAGNGSGVVTSVPTGLSCGSDCSEVYPYGTAVALTSMSAAGSVFTGWSGGGCSGTGSCVVTVTGATTVTATFALPQHTLTVTRTGSGAGTVTSSPSGVSCGADCSEPYTSGTAVTLSASPASGSAFSGWSGGGCAGVGTCVVTVTGATTVIAGFSDVAPPTLVSSTPADATTGMDEGTTIRLAFSEPMNQAATEAAFEVTQPAGVTGTFQWQGSVMTFTPTSRFACLPGGNVVLWRLSTSARDVAGNLLAAPVDRSFRVVRCVEHFLFSEASRDGSVTNGGAVTATAADIYVGDFPNASYARGFVSFDFSSIPGDAVVSGATLEMAMTQLGTVSQLGPLLAEPLVYGTLGSSDFGLAPSGPAVAAAVSTGLATWTVDAAMVSAWANRANLGSRFQLRLRTTYDNHLNGLADAFDFGSGESTDPALRPLLLVKYRAH